MRRAQSPRLAQEDPGEVAPVVPGLGLAGEHISTRRAPLTVFIAYMCCQHRPGLRGKLSAPGSDGAQPCRLQGMGGGFPRMRTPSKSLPRFILTKTVLIFARTAVGLGFHPSFAVLFVLAVPSTG